MAAGMEGEAMAEVQPFFYAIVSTEILESNESSAAAK